MNAYRKRIVIGTFNRGKEREIRRILSGIPVRLVSLRDIPDAPRVMEDGTTFRENARKKALLLARALGETVLAEDSGIEVDALGGRPGVLSARYAGEGAGDSANNAKLLSELRGVSAERRTARYRCSAVLAEPGRVLAEADGACEGRIASCPKGRAGFGYDPIFVVPGYGKTVGELGIDVKERISHRAQAVRKLGEFLMGCSKEREAKVLARRVARWMRERVRKAGAKGIVVGLSGGVDSAVVAVLARKAVGEKVLALLLPCRSEGADERDARLVARKFGIRTRKVDLTEALEVLLKRLPSANRIAVGNLKPRLRMTTLYYFANKLNYLVAGTGNKSETMMGYFTKYGDGGVDILPIGDLLKREVRALARVLGIEERIIEKVPTAGLWPGQTDEGEMGITYDVLDAVLSGESRDRGSKRMVAAMVARSEHKRRLPEVFKHELRTSYP